MNAELATPPAPVQDTQPAISLFPNPPTHAANPGDRPVHRKIAKLPSALLNLVNTLMDDNHSNREILLALTHIVTSPGLALSLLMHLQGRASRRRDCLN